MASLALILYQISVTCGLGLACLSTWMLDVPLKNTSLQASWRWGLAAEFAWFTTSLISCCASANSPLMDQFWFWTLILTLCPFISALGARRPTNRVWNRFIISPLIAVLGWPGLTVLSSWPIIAPLKLQAPACIGFGLVLVMGVGNYISTRFTLPAVLAGLAVLLGVASLTSLAEFQPASTEFLRTTGGLMLMLAVFVAIRRGLQTAAEESPFDRLWFDFRDTFGIVWSLRIQDRLNQTAEKEAWSCRLGTMGFEWEHLATIESREQTEQKMLRALHWYLRRFVDPEWIESRISSSSELRCKKSQGTSPVPDTSPENFTFDS